MVRSKAEKLVVKKYKQEILLVMKHSPTVVKVFQALIDENVRMTRPRVSRIWAICSIRPILIG